MSYDLRQWPASVYPGELKLIPDAQVGVDVVLRAMRQDGPRPEGFSFKPLGKGKAYLWQINLKIVSTKRQVRILYAPYGRAIVVFHIHKKSSPQEQKAGYAVAMQRKKDAERSMQQSGIGHAALPNIGTAVH